MAVALQDLAKLTNKTLTTLSGVNNLAGLTSRVWQSSRRVPQASHRFGLVWYLPIIGFHSTDLCTETARELISVFNPLFDIGGLAVDQPLKLIGEMACDPLELTLPFSHEAVALN